MDKTMADTVMDIVDIVLMMIAILVVTIHEIWQRRRRCQKEAEWPKMDLRSLTDAELEDLLHGARLGEGVLAAVAFEIHRRGMWPKEAEK